MRRIEIDPITRLEGHGKIEIMLDDAGNVLDARLQIPEFRGFERFCEGRPVEELPRITQKICGVCPTAHHTASAKTLDAVFKVTPPPAAVAIRELMYNAFMYEDHMLHFFVLGGPDFIVGPDAPAGERNVLGVVAKVGIDIGKKLIGIRKRVRNLMSIIAGSPLDPVFGLPGGVSRALTQDDRAEAGQTAAESVDFALFSLKALHDIVLSNPVYLKLITGDVYYLPTYYMGQVDKENRVNFYDGDIRVVDQDGKEFAKFAAADYLDHVRETAVEWSYLKVLYLKKLGWKGFEGGKENGMYRVAPLARLNVSDSMPSPLAQEHFEEMIETFGGKPIHNTLAYHWARLIEALAAAERMKELAEAPELTDPNVRAVIENVPSEGVGVVEAPRGTLFHHYITDEKGIVQKVNLLVATQNNAGPICASVDKAAKCLIKNGEVNDGLLNMVEMAFRAYDPCMACATHAITGSMPLSISFVDPEGRIIRKFEK